MSRRPVAIGLSVVLHGALFYALSRAPGAASAGRTAEPPPPAVVWLASLRLPEPVPSEPQAEATPPESPAVEPAPPPTAPAEPPPRPRATRAPKPRPAAEPAPAVEPVTPAPAPRIDWDKERRAAIADTLGKKSGGLVLSADDIPDRRQPLPMEPAPPAMTDHCVIFKNRFQAMMMAMMGKCVRDARGDLFADARPDYLDEHPVCRETRPDSPGVVASDGRVISTVKCDLVAEDQDDATPPR